MNEQIEKLEHGLMICEATGTELVHIEKADAEKILALLKKQPEIICCKDCIWYDQRDGQCEHHICINNTSPEWFCADGERRDNDD